MIALFTDFGPADPYVGQVHAVLAREAPGVPVIDLLHAVPAFDIRAGAYLLPAYAQEFPSGSVLVCVVDPGVGGARKALMLAADGRWYVGPDNGLLTLIARRARDVQCNEIQWRPAQLSTSFHGRDLFAPVAAMLARGTLPAHAPVTLDCAVTASWPDDLPRVLYIDHYGNAITGMRAAIVPQHMVLHLRGQALHFAPTFSAVPPGKPFWYVNANGLVEIAVNRGSAAAALQLQLGDEID